MSNDKPSSESSHSPTEQPGDAKHTRGPWHVWFDDEDASNYCVSSEKEHSPGVPELDLYLGRLEVPDEIRKANAELIARAPDLLSEVSTLRSKQAELVEEIERLKSQLKDYCNDCQHPSVNERQAAELSKLRQENERYKEALQCMINVEHHGDFMNAFFDLKDQVKAALQGE